MCNGIRYHPLRSLPRSYEFMNWTERPSRILLCCSREEPFKEQGEMAYAGRMQFARPLEGVQELIPGIRDHITLQFIASKLNWETCDVLQMVSWGWRHAIRSGKVYDARVLSKSTDAFLVLRNDDFGDLDNYVLTLYSCKNGSSLPLPPLPKPERAEYYVQYGGICLHGVVYVWVTTNEDSPIWVENFLCALDLGGGSKKWTMLERKKYPYGDFRYGVFEGKIYRFGGWSPAFRDIFGDVFDGRPHDAIDRKAAIDRWEPGAQPITEFYNPLSDDWSRVIPESLSDMVPLCNWRRFSCGYDCGEDLIAFAFEWARQQQASAIDDPRCAATAAQVYYMNGHFDHIFFLGENLLKFVGSLVPFGSDNYNADIQVYDAHKNTWETWKTFSAYFFLGLNEADVSCYITNFVSVDGAIWAILAIHYYKTVYKSCLVRSLILLGEDDDEKFLLWTDTGCSLQKGETTWKDNVYCMEKGDCGLRKFLRPIYL